MHRLLIPALLLVIAACSRGPNYDYTTASQAVLINAVSPEAYYYSFGTYSYDQAAYAVNWDVPGIVEKAVRDASPVEFTDYVAPAWMVGIDMSTFEAQLQAEGSSQIKSTATGVCMDTGADVLVVLGTVGVDWSQGGTARVSQGYGLMTRSGTAQRRFWAYSVPAAVMINCNPVDYAGQAVAYRMPIEMTGFRPSLAVDRLSDAQRLQIKTAVLSSLEKGQGGNAAPVTTVARAVAAIFDPLAKPVANVTPNAKEEEKPTGAWGDE